MNHGWQHRPKHDPQQRGREGEGENEGGLLPNPFKVMGGLKESEERGVRRPTNGVRWLMVIIPMAIGK